jgi:hypothetical protein
MRASALLASIALALFVASCGGAAPRRAIVPMTPEAELSFENGLDFIDDPSILEGNWLEDWERDIAQRVELCEAVLVVRITAVQQNVDLERNLSYRLVAHIDTVRFGTGFEDDITLVSREGEAGYHSVHSNQSRLLQQQFIAYLRYVETETGEIIPRWHLSPAADRIVRRTNSLLDGRRSGESRRRVIVHDSRDPSAGEAPPE